MTFRLHHGDLPDDFDAGDSIAIDTEPLGLNPVRDRLCLVQMSRGDGSADLVKIAQGQTSAPNLVRMLADPNVLKLFHFARFDIAILQKTFGVVTKPV
jgi:ribonuclease D